MFSRNSIRENVELAPLTTLKVGGPARYFAVARSELDVKAAIAFAGELDLPLFVLGGGSNLLVSDAGFRGLVLQNRIEGIARLQNPSAFRVTLDVGAGEEWDAFVAKCVTENLAGVECLSGIPGTVGATPIQNVGAYGQEVSETIESVACVDRISGEGVRISNPDCLFDYRSSAFNGAFGGRYIITSVRFEFNRGAVSRPAYRDLQARFGGGSPNLAEVRSAVMETRSAKSMVLNRNDPNSRSAGSFFKNPIVSVEKLAELAAVEASIPSFENGSDFKIPAAWLIERAGVSKGFVLGRAGVSSNHSLAIINRGDATAAEIVVLRDEIRRRVAEKYGIDLQQEPVMLGFD